MATPILWGGTSDIFVNTTTLSAQISSQVVGLLDGTFLVIWADASGLSGSTGWDIRGQIFNADGSKKGAEFLVTRNPVAPEEGVIGNQTAAKVAVLEDGRFVVSWEDSAADTNGGITARVFNPANLSLGSDFHVNTTVDNYQSKTSTAKLANGGYVITYSSLTPVVGTEVKAQAYDKDGNKIGGEVSVNATTALEQTDSTVIGLSNGNYAVFYADTSLGTQDSSGPLDNKPTIRGRIFTPDGNQAVAEFVVPSSHENKVMPKAIALANGKFLVLWTHQGPMGDGFGAAIKGQIFNPDGTRYRSEFLVNGNINNDQYDASAVALADGGFAVSYTNGSSSSVQSYGVATFDGNGVKTGDDYTFRMPLGASATGDGKSSLGILADGRLILSWSDDGRGRGATAEVGVYAHILDPRDKAVTLVGKDLDDQFIGTRFNDSLSGKVGGDQLRGEEGDDTLIGGKGADTLNGGADNDTASYEDAEERVIVNLVTPAANRGDAENDVLTSIENVTGSIYADTLTGDSNANVLKGLADHDILAGGGGNDQLEGGEGNDQLDGGTGADILIGGNGDDTYLVDDANDKVQEAVGGGSDTVTASVSYVLDANAEVEVLEAAAGSAAINLVGNGIANTLRGNSAANQLDGGGGADVLEGQAGNDTYVIDHLGDVVTELAGDDQGSDTVVIASNFDADNTYELSAFANTENLLALNGAGDVSLVGNSVANTITGNDGNNTLNGGNDALTDILAGGKGNDTYVIRDGRDTLIERVDEGTDTALVGFSGFELGRDISIEVIRADTSGGLSDFTLTGNNLANTITGSSGRDVLDGGGTAGDRADSLKGGAGDDLYYVRHSGDVVDEGSSEGNDKIIASVNYVLLDNSFVESVEAAAGTQKIDLTGNRESNTLVGNNANNVLEGRGGDDMLDGGEGMDTAVFTGSKADYIITWNADGTVTVADKTANRDGSDTLKSIRYAQFSDAIVDLEQLPTVSVVATDAVKEEGTAEDGWTVFTFTVTRSSDIGLASVKWVFSGIAGGVHSDDRSGTVLFAQGVKSQQITIRVRADATPEDTETFNIVLSDATGATISNGTASGVIINDDFSGPTENTAPDFIRLTTGGLTAYFDEHKSGDQVVATVTATDDAGPAGLRYSMSHDVFEIDAVTGQIKVKGGVALDHTDKDSYTVTVTVTDLNGTGLSRSQDITIKINDVSERPTGISFGEDQPLKVGLSGTGADVVLATAVDPDTVAAFRNNLYRFDNGQSTTPDGLFVINANTGQITLARAVTADDVGTKTFNVVTYDATNPALFHVQSHSITVAAADNDTPTSIMLSKRTVEENSGEETVVAILSAIDKQGGLDIESYSIVDDEDGKFEIVGNELRLKAGVDHETKDEHSVRILVKDKAGNEYAQTFTIKVKDVNERPRDITFVDAPVLKVGVSGTGASVTRARAVDPDEVSTASVTTSTNLYQFDNGLTVTSDGLFVINAATGEITTTRAIGASDIGIKTFNVVTYDVTNPSLRYVKGHNVAILAADPPAPTANKQPTDLRLTTGGTVANVDEHKAGGHVVAAVTVTDEGGVFYSMAPNAAFEIDRTTGQIRVKGGIVLDYEAQNSYTVTVTATDTGGLSTSQNFTIVVNDQTDVFRGGTGKDVLTGTAGKDILYGDYGNDTLTGGLGQDVFVFNSKLGTSKTDRKVNFDTITDFNVADDSFWLDNAIFKKIGKSGSETSPVQLNKKYFKVATKAKDKDDYIVYDKKKGVLYYDADGSGSKAAIEIAKLAKNLKLTYSDFFVV